MSEATTADTGATGEQSAFGLEPNIAAAISCFFAGTVLVPLIFYVVAEDEFTKFHSVQAIIIGVIGYVTLIGWVITLPVSLFLAYKAYQGDMTEIPVIGGFAKGMA